MTHRVFGFIAALMVAGSTLGTLVQSASAHETGRSGRVSQGDYRRGDRDGSDDDYPQIRRAHRRAERSYYYEDPYCGQRSSHISDFKGHYSRAGHRPLILKVDIRSGRILNRYRYDYDQEEWRDWDRRSCSDDDARSRHDGRYRSQDDD